MSVRAAFGAYLAASRVRWGPYVSFSRAACDVLRAAHDEGLDTDAVRGCFAGVGLALQACSLDGVEHVLCQGQAGQGGQGVKGSRSGGSGQGVKVR